MQVNFKTRKLQKIFNSERALQKNYGADTAKRIGWRMKVLKYAPNLSLIPVTRPERLHQLTGESGGPVCRRSDTEEATSFFAQPRSSANKEIRRIGQKHDYVDYHFRGC